MSLLVSKRGIIQYFLLYFFIIWHSAGMAFVIGKERVDYIIITICAICFIVYKKCRVHSMVLFCILMTINVIFVRLMSGGIGLQYLLHCIAALMITYISFHIEPEKFVERYVKIVLFLSVTSVIIWLITLINPDIYKNITVTSYVPFYKQIYSSKVDYISKPVTFYGSLLYVLRPDSLRNNGIFNEPGLYQIILNTAMYFVLFYPNLITDNIKKCRKYIVILLITLITCQSTTGYISLAVMLICYMFTKQNFELKRNILKLVFVGVCILGIDFAINGYTSLIGSVIGKKITMSTGGIEFIGTGAARMSTFPIFIASLAKNPFGIGSDQFNELLFLAGKTSSDGAALLEIIAKLGIQMILILIIIYIIPSWRNRKSKMLFMVTIFLYINTTMGQAEFFYPSLMCLMMPFAYLENQHKIDE